MVLKFGVWHDENIKIYSVEKNTNLNSYNAMATGRTVCTQEDHLMWSKDPEQLLKGTRVENCCFKGWELKI